MEIPNHISAVLSHPMKTDELMLVCLCQKDYHLTSLDLWCVPETPVGRHYSQP